MSAANVAAFLSTIAISEGTKGVGDDGYNVIVGGALFDDYSTHPGVRVWLPKLKVYSSAAGRYQVKYSIWEAYWERLGLPDFGHVSQDRIALQLITECGALEAVEAGRFAEAIDKCKSRWASLPGAGYGQRENSLPGAGYGQRENSLPMLRTAFVGLGGVLAA